MDIKEYCKTVGITMKAFALRCRVPLTTISAIANKKRYAGSIVSKEIERASEGFVMSNSVTKPTEDRKYCWLCHNKVSQDTYKRIEKTFHD